MDFDQNNSTTNKTTSDSTNQPVKVRRTCGFASLKANNPERLREIARRGGISAHRQGVAHEWDQSQAKAAGRKGGLATKASNEKKRSLNKSQESAA